MGRTACCSKEGLNRGTWTANEDQILKDYIRANGEGQWRNLPKRAGLRRCGKSCRLRWLNYLRPNIKRGNISPEEEDLILRLHKLLGNRWALIARRLPGRTDNEIKNYWNTNLSKKFKNPPATATVSKPIPRRGGAATQKSAAIRTKATACAKAAPKVTISNEELEACTLGDAAARDKVIPGMDKDYSIPAEFSKGEDFSLTNLLAYPAYPDLCHYLNDEQNSDSSNDMKGLSFLPSSSSSACSAETTEIMLSQQEAELIKHWIGNPESCSLNVGGET